MTITGSFENFGDKVTYEITEEKKNLIVKRLIDYYSKNCYFGEAIHQDDDSIIDAPSVLADIADDIIKFKVQEEE